MHGEDIVQGERKHLKIPCPVMGVRVRLPSPVLFFVLFFFFSVVQTTVGFVAQLVEQWKSISHRFESYQNRNYKF